MMENPYNDKETLKLAISHEEATVSCPHFEVDLKSSALKSNSRET
jgi:hypothetical protein